MTNANSINLSWLLKLRWGAALGQLLVIAFVQVYLRIHLPLAPLLAAVFVQLLTNLAATFWMRRSSTVNEWTLWAVMALDVVILTTLLYLTGGPFNPFSSLYLVHIALAAAILTSRLSWLLVALCCLCFGVLFVDHVWLKLDSSDTSKMQHNVQIHLQGMWVAFALAAGFIVHFVHRVTSALSLRNAQLSEARAQAARSEKIVALATLSAGAAHELSTPLSSIAVAARELERQLTPNGAEAAADAALIRQQVQRGREILLQMAADAEVEATEPAHAIGVASLLDEAAAGLSEDRPIRIELTEQAARCRLSVPHRTVTRGFEAS
ncbi:MAG: sensor histidine kinase [Myxococcales bacterium]|nr:sensor histidine kinase [Myxococcales bacterium]